MKIVGKNYITGIDRCEWGDSCVAHLYDGDFNDPGRPMCAYGWNRGNGFGYSIFRGSVCRKGVCKICMRRAKAKLPSVFPRMRKTVYI